MGTAFESPMRSLVHYFDHSVDQADATDALNRMSETYKG